MTRIIGISSGKGGVGKSTVSANLAIALNKLDEKVLLVDCNLSTPHLSYYLGVNNYQYTLNDIIADRVEPEDAIYNYDGVRFIPSSLKLQDLIGVDLRLFKKTIQKTINPDEYDYIILDSAPGLGREAICVLHSANELLFVTTPFVPVVNDVIRSVNVLKQMGDKKAGVILNMVTGDSHELFNNAIQDVMNIPIVGEIPFDDRLDKSIVMNTPIVNYSPVSPATIGFMKLAANLSGEKYEPPNRFEQTFYRIKNKIFESTSSRIQMPQTKKLIEREMILQEGQNTEKLKKLV